MLSVVIYKMGRVNAVHLKPARLAVRSLGSLRSDDELPAHHIVFAFSVRIQAECRHDDEFSVVIGNVWCPDAMGIPDVLQVQFIGIRDGMPDDMPVHHIL